MIIRSSAATLMATGITIFSTFFSATLFIQRQPMLLSTTNEDKVNMRLYDANACLGTNCHRSKWSAASFFLFFFLQTGSVPYRSFLICSQLHWLSLKIRCKKYLTHLRQTKQATAMAMMIKSSAATLMATGITIFSTFLSATLMESVTITTIVLTHI